MAKRHKTIHIPVDGHSIDGVLVTPVTSVPGVLLINGRDGSTEQHLARAQAIANLGSVCLTCDLRGHGPHQASGSSVSPEDNLNELLAAFNLLASHPAVDGNSVMVAASNYGAYLSTLLTALKPVRWIALRAPGLYKDEEWMHERNGLSRLEGSNYRALQHAPTNNKALAASSRYRGDVLLIASERDQTVPSPVIESYHAAFLRARSMTYRVIEGADHTLSTPAWANIYTKLLVQWILEIFNRARMVPDLDGFAAQEARAGKTDSDIAALGPR